MAQILKRDLAQAIESGALPPIFINVSTDPDNNRQYFESQLINIETAKDVVRNMELSEHVEFGVRLQPYWAMKMTKEQIKEATGLSPYTQEAAKKTYLALKDHALHIYKLKELTISHLHRLTERQIAACLPNPEPVLEQDPDITQLVPEQDNIRTHYQLGTGTLENGETFVIRKKKNRKSQARRQWEDLQETAKELMLCSAYPEEQSGPSTDKTWPEIDVRYHPY